MSGPPPRPTKLKLLDGNPGHQKLNKHEPQPGGVATCPTWLDLEAKREWRRISKELRRLGLLTSVDRAALAAYCDCYATWRLNRQVLSEEGFTTTIETKGGGLYSQQRPEVAIVQKSLQLMKSYLVEFGLTPAARARISMPDKLEDDLDVLLG